MNILKTLIVDKVCINISFSFKKGSEICERIWDKCRSMSDDIGLVVFSDQNRAQAWVCGKIKKL